MKTQYQVVSILTMMLINGYSHALTIDGALKVSVDAFKGEIYKALKGDKNIAPHIPKTAKDHKSEKLQICKFWLDQYSRSETEKNEIKTIESCTAAGIDMTKYQK